MTERPPEGMTTHRLEALTDGIFAIAMTLLVLNLRIDSPASSLNADLLALSQKFFDYILSFIFLAIFWVWHHQQTHLIKRTNHAHLWINIFIMMFIALVPFSTSLLGDYENEVAAEAFFAANFLFLSGLFLLNYYAAIGWQLTDPLDRRGIREALFKGWVVLLISLAAFTFSFLIPSYSSLLFLLIPLILYGRKRRGKRG